MTAFNTYNMGQTYIIRGIGFNDSSFGSRQAVAIYQDHAELPLAIMVKGATLALERIEVLKGPQRTLFGHNATGGLVGELAFPPILSNWSAPEPTAPNPLGIQYCSHHTVLTVDIHRALRWAVELLGGRVLNEAYNPYLKSDS